MLGPEEPTWVSQKSSKIYEVLLKLHIKDEYLTDPLTQAQVNLAAELLVDVPELSVEAAMKRASEASQLNLSSTLMGGSMKPWSSGFYNEIIGAESGVPDYQSFISKYMSAPGFTSPVPTEPETGRLRRLKSWLSFKLDPSFTGDVRFALFPWMSALLFFGVAVILTGLFLSTANGFLTPHWAWPIFWTGMVLWGSFGKAWVLRHSMRPAKGRENWHWYYKLLYAVPRPRQKVKEVTGPDADPVGATLTPSAVTAALQHIWSSVIKDQIIQQHKNIVLGAGVVTSEGKIVGWTDEIKDMKINTPGVYPIYQHTDPGENSST